MVEGHGQFFKFWSLVGVPQKGVAPKNKPTKKGP